MNDRTILTAAGLSLAIATVCGALAAHALKSSLSAQSLEVFETGVRYHFYHSLGLLGIAVAARHARSVWVSRAAWLVLVGMILFSGSVYALTFGAPRVIGVVTPIGGLALIIGWVTFAFAIRSAD